MTSDAQIKAFIDRILRLKEEQDSIGDDIRDIYAEAKSMGFDKTAMGNVVAHLRKVAKKGHDTVAEQGAIFDMYLAAYEGKSSHAPAPAPTRENIEKFDTETGEIIDADISAKLVETIAAGVQTEVGRKALIAAVDIMIEQEEAEEEFQAKASGDNGATGQAAEVPADSVTGDVSRPSRGGDTPASNTEMDRDVLRGDEFAHAVPAENARKAVPETEDGSVTHAGAGESPAATFNVKPRSALRPNCRNREACAGYGDRHCHACTVAMREKAEEVA